MQVEARQIITPAPFSLKATALSHGWHECSPMSWSEGGRCFQIIDRWEDEPLRVSIVEGPRVDSKVPLRVTVEGRGLDDQIVEYAARRARLTLGLDRDLSGFYALCAKHPTLKVLPRIGAGRGLRSASMVENVVKALCATNVNWSQAVKMINRIGQLGPPVPHFVSFNAWPTPAEILKAGEDYLLNVARVGYRSASILRFCRDIVDGAIDVESLDADAARPDVSSDALLKRLRSIHGIGPSSAHYLLSFLGRHDRVSVDSATIAHVARTHMKGKKPTVKQVEAVYAPYGNWRQMVFWYEHWLTWGTAGSLLREHGLA